MSVTYKEGVGGWTGEPTLSVGKPDKQIQWPLTIPQIIVDIGIPCYLINAPQWPHGVCFGLSWLDRVGKKPSVKTDLVIT